MRELPIALSLLFPRRVGRGTTGLWARSLKSPLSVVQDRFLDLANRPEFPEFFAFPGRRADHLLAPCHWLAMGSNLLEEREARIPTAAELIRLVQLIRRQRPDLLDFVHSLVIRSPLATVAASVARPLVTEDEQPRSRNQVIDTNEQENETIYSCHVAGKDQNTNVPPNNVPPNNVAPNTEPTPTVPIRSPR